MSAPSSPARGLGPGVTFVLALACGALAANLYYAQPLVALMAADLGLPAGVASSVVTVAQLGYALGLVFLVPLGDRLENRRLIAATMALDVVGLLGLALGRGPVSAFVAMAFVGLASSAAQMIVPLAASLAPEHGRGRAVGNVMSGLLGGILLARPLASFLAGPFGWRGVFLLSAGLVTGALLVLWRVAPRRTPGGGEPYFALIRSLGTLFVTEPVLRRRALGHATMFGAFSLFWTASPILLMRAPYDLSSSQVALFTLAGVLGVFAAPVAGRWADAGHTFVGTAVALASVVVSFAACGWGLPAVWVLAVAGAIIDAGVQVNLVLGQRAIYQLRPELRSRLNSVYMTVFFVGGAAGSALASPLLESGGWLAVCVVGAAAPGSALAYHLWARPSGD